MAGKSNERFKTGDLVFAKMKGFPHWPARIHNPEHGSKKRVLVYFFGTHQIGSLLPENIVPYVGNKTKYGTGVRIKGFTEGMWEIQNTPGVGSKLKMPTKSSTQTTAKTTPAKGTSAASNTTVAKKNTNKPALSKTPTKTNGKKETASGDRPPVRASLRVAQDKTTDSKVTPGKKLTVKEAAAGPATTTRNTRSGGSLVQQLVMPTDSKKPKISESKSADKSKISINDGLPKVQEKKEPEETKAKLPENQGVKRKREEEKEEEGKEGKETTTEGEATTKKKKENRDREMKEEVNKLPTDGEGMRTRRSGKEEQRKTKQDGGVEKKKVTRRNRAERKSRQEAVGGEEEEVMKNTDEEEGEDGAMDEERQRIAAKRERVLKSLRGLITTTKGVKRKESVKRAQTAVRIVKKKKTEGTSTDRRSIKEPAVTKVVLRRTESEGSSRKIKTMEEDINASKPAEVKLKDGNTQEKKPDRDEEIKEKKSEDMKQHKEERNIIGKFVKVPGAKVQVKTMGGVSTIMEDKKKTDQKSSEKANEVEGGKKDDKKKLERVAKEVDTKKKGDEERRKKSRDDGQKKTEDTQGGKLQEDKVTTKDQKRRDGKNEILQKDEKGTTREQIKKEGKNEEHVKKDEKMTEQTEKVTREQKRKDGKNDIQEQKHRKTTAEQMEKVNMREQRKKDGKSETHEKKDEKTAAEKGTREKKKDENNETQQKKDDKSTTEKTGKVTTREQGKQDAKTEAHEKKDEKMTEQTDKAATREQKRKDGKSEAQGKKDEKTAAEKVTEQKKVEKSETQQRKGEKMTEQTEKAATREHRKKDGQSKMEKKNEESTSKMEKKNEECTSKMEKKNEEITSCQPEKRMIREQKSEMEKNIQTTVERTKTDEETLQLHASQTKTTSISAEEERKKADEELKPKKSVGMTLTDSTLHRIHGDIRISLKGDNPDISKCILALDQLSMVYVTSQHVQRHSELVATLRKLRFYRVNQAIVHKASMLYNRFKNAFLLGEGEEVVSAAFLRSLLEEKEMEEAQRVERCRDRREDLLQEVKKRMDQVKERKREEEAETLRKVSLDCH